ncbi:amine oxidase [copper-containing], partial [Biomphalaria pfeifferi]
MKPLLLFWLLLVNCFEAAYNSYEGAYKCNDAYLENIPRPCGSHNPNQNVVDLREPQSSGPFHDLTIFELTH